MITGPHKCDSSALFALFAVFLSLSAVPASLLIDFWEFPQFTALACQTSMKPLNATIVTGFPGVGKLMIDSILQRDFSVVLAAIIVTAIAIFLMNILIDIAYAVLHPRIRY